MLGKDIARNCKHRYMSLRWMTDPVFKPQLREWSHQLGLPLGITWLVVKVTMQQSWGHSWILHPDYVQQGLKERLGDNIHLHGNPSTKKSFCLDTIKDIAEIKAKIVNKWLDKQKMSHDKESVNKAISGVWSLSQAAEQIKRRNGLGLVCVDEQGVFV